jgi:hypothetical protein
LADYYRKFIKNFGIIRQPLTQLLKKGILFVWTSIHDRAFETLKNAPITSLALALPNFSTPFVIETNSSDGGVGAILM